MTLANVPQYIGCSFGRKLPAPTHDDWLRNSITGDAASTRRAVGDALAQLSGEHRAVVRRSYYLGWTTAQIADDLQITDGTVKSRLHYALRALRLTLQEKGVMR